MTHVNVRLLGIEGYFLLLKQYLLLVTIDDKSFNINEECIAH